MTTVPRANVVAAILAAGFLSLPQQDSMAPGIEDLVERIEDRYDDTSIRAHFVQNRISRLGSVVRSEEGELYIRTPGQMRWEYTSSSMLMVAGGRGRETYMYQPDENVVQIIRSGVDDPSQYPLMYLSGRGNLSRDFRVEVVEWATPLARNHVQLELTPRRSRTSFERLILEVDPVRATIARLVNFDRLRNIVEYRFEDVEYDVDLSDELFEFEIPDDVEVRVIGG